MKKFLIAVLVLALLILTIGGCGSGEDVVSSAPEIAVSSGLPEWSTTTTTEKEMTAGKDHSTTRRCPLTSRITTTTTVGTTTVNCTYPTVPFSRGATVRVRDESFKEDFSGRVITNKTQLDALTLDAEYETDNYDHNFFEDNALVVLEFRLTSGSIQLRVDSIGMKGNTMIVSYTTLRPTPFTNDLAYRRVLLEVDRNKVKNVKTIVGEESRINSNYSNPTVF